MFDYTADVLQKKVDYDVLEISSSKANETIQSLCNNCLNPIESNRPTIQNIQKIISGEYKKHYIIQNVEFYDNYSYDDVVKNAQEGKKLSEITNVPYNNKYYWIFIAYFLLSKLNSTNLHLFLGYFFFYGDEFRRDNRKDKYDNHKNFDFALYHLKIAEEKGNSEAIITLGNIYKNGVSTRTKVIPKDHLMAKYYYEKACKLNDSNAYLQLGEWYFNEQYKEHDYSKGKENYEKSALMNNPEALCRLGNIYYE